jgi:membrane-associated phospholipid phosphatase
VSRLPVRPRGTPSRERRLPVTVAWLVSVLVALLALMLGVGALLSRVERGSTFERVDAGIPRWFAAQRAGVLDGLSAVAAELGNTAVVLAVAVLAGVLALVVLRSWRPMVIIAVALAGEVTIFLTTAAVVDRPRPPVAHLDAELPPTSSFPSGHTAAAICLYGALAAVAVIATRGRRRRSLVGLAVVLVVLVALARLYRGAHYPTDVLGSLLFALPWLLAVVRLLGPPRSPRHASRGPAGSRDGGSSGESSPDTVRFR